MEAIPWGKLLIDIISLYKIRIEGHKEHLILKALTMIYTVTRWSELVRYNDKHAANTANLVYQAWLCRYPRPKIITYDSRNELLGHAIKLT